MQLIFWDEDEVPENMISHGNGDIDFFDYPHWNAFDLDDRIVVLTPMGPEMYIVIDVGPEYDLHDTQEMHRVTIRSVY